MRAPERLADNIHFHQLQVSAWGGLRGLYSASVMALRRAVRRLRPEVVHGQGSERYAALAAAFSGFPNLITIHGNMQSHARLYQARPFTFFWLCAHLEALTVRRTGGVLCLTNHTLREVRNQARRTWLLPNAVNSRYFTVQRQPDPRPTILCVADILAHKNQLRLIEALAPLAAQSGLRLKFAGAGLALDPYFQEFKRRLTGSLWCEYEGFWPLDRLLAELARATLLVLPSLEDNCPMAVMEAMAAGVPVAAARVGGVPDLIEPGRNGELFDSLSIEDMRAQIGGLLARADYREQLGLAGRQAARERFTPAVIAAGHRRIYEELLKG
jgi:glycosyltransferase involved in cell wall biosynthesis